MPGDHIRYDLLAQDALRGVVHSVLADAAKNGLPGEHHFYITFATRAEGVHISQRLIEQYPNEMTIVLQHQFWNLVVGESGFEVGLSFGGIPERLAVPFAAINGFFDPSVQFGLQFEEIRESSVEGSGATASPAERPATRLPAEQRTRPSSGPPAVPIAANPAAAPDEPAATGDAKPETGAEVVRLDRFRKK
jgi:hypothetical protein